MESQELTTYLEKAKELVLKNKQVAIGAAAAVVLGLVGWNVYESQPKSVVGELEVTFSGYDGYGVLDASYEDIHEEIARVAYKSAGFSKGQIEEILNEDTLIMADIEADSKLESKYKKAQAIIRGTSYQFNKTNELSNGDKVVLAIKNTSSKSPIKKEKKTFKVSGLEAIETISTKDFLKDYPVTFVGFNGYGRVVLPEDDNGNELLNVTVTENDGSYKNGDTVALTVSPSYLSQLLEDGQKLEDKNIEVKVSDLKEITDISNTADALAKNEVYAKSQYESGSYYTYALEKQKSYISYDTSYSGNSSSGQVYLTTIFKITETTSSSSKVYYANYGYRYYVKSDNTLDLETANKEYSSTTQDLENLIAELKTEGYKEYTVKAD